MASIRWRGGAVAVAQVTTYAFGGTWQADDLVRISVGSKKLDVVAASTVTNTVIDNVVTAWNAALATDYPELAEATASRSSSNLVLTGDTAGVPFSITLTPLESDGSAADAQTIEGAGVATTGTVSTAATGAEDFDDPYNWSGSAAPAGGDTLTIENADDDILYSIDQNGITVAALNLPASFTGTLGLPETNALTATGYPEYRQRSLKIGMTACNVGEGPGQGSGRVLLDAHNIQTTLNVRSTGSPLEADVAPLQWKGTHASNVVNVFGGEVGIAPLATDVATVATLRVGGSARVRCGAGCTLTTVSQDGGELTLNSAATTVTKARGTLTVLGTGAVTTLTSDDGDTVYSSSGTVTTLNVGGGRADFSQDMRPKVVTNCNLYAGGEIYDPFGVVTFTNGISLKRCRLSEVNIDVGENRVITPS